MIAELVSLPPFSAGTVDAPDTPDTPDAQAARTALRRQIARLESRLSALAVELGSCGRWQPMPGLGTRARRGAGARLLTLGDLEATRDELVSQMRGAERSLARCVEAEHGARCRLEAMLAEPAEYRFQSIPLAELGEPGCGAYQVRPRLGLLGMLFGWWCIKLSSGCPLSMAYHQSRDRRRSEWGRNARFERTLTISVLVLVVAVMLVFLLVYHDIPLRVP